MQWALEQESRYGDRDQNGALVASELSRWKGALGTLRCAGNAHLDWAGVPWMHMFAKTYQLHI